MSIYWTIPFVLGVFVGQEFSEIPKVRPYLQAALRKISKTATEISEEAKKEAKKETKKNEGINFRDELDKWRNWSSQKNEK